MYTRQFAPPPTNKKGGTSAAVTIYVQIIRSNTSATAAEKAYSLTGYTEKDNVWCRVYLKRRYIIVYLKGAFYLEIII